jgi:hypothetical protein
MLFEGKQLQKIKNMFSLIISKQSTKGMFSQTIVNLSFSAKTGAKQWNKKNI